jgi:hypothetical protein
MMTYTHNFLVQPGKHPPGECCHSIFEPSLITRLKGLFRGEKHVTNLLFLSEDAVTVKEAAADEPHEASV